MRMFQDRVAEVNHSSIVSKALRQGIRTACPFKVIEGGRGTAPDNTLPILKEKASLHGVSGANKCSWKIVF